MNKTRITALAALTILTGCTINTAPQATPTTVPVTTTTLAVETTITAPATTSAADPVGEFLVNVKSKTTLGASFDDATLVRMAKLFCDAFDDGSSSQDVTGIIAAASVENGLSESEMLEFVEVLVSGVQAFCPWNMWKLSQ